MLYIRFHADSGDISGVFPAEYWEGNIPEGHDYITVSLDAETGEALMNSPESYVIRDDGTGPALYERGE